jgi:hypothetical protein
MYQKWALCQTAQIIHLLVLPIHFKIIGNTVIVLQEELNVSRPVKVFRQRGLLMETTGAG